MYVNKINSNVAFSTCPVNLYFKVKPITYDSSDNTRKTGALKNFIFSLISAVDCQIRFRFQKANHAFDFPFLKSPMQCSQ